MRRRTRARELALQFLYVHDLRGDEVLGELDEFLAEGTEEESVAAHARSLVEGVIENRPQIDARISAVAHNWEINRIAVVDRNIIRVALFEMMCTDDVPRKVAINEAIEIAKKFSSANSGGFINGILDAVRKQLGDKPSDSGSHEDGKTSTT